MGISNFPAALQSIIQGGFLEREFQNALESRLGYRAVADRQEFAVGIGETLTKTRAGLKPAVTTPLAAASNTNLDNGQTPVGGAASMTVTVGSNAYTLVGCAPDGTNVSTAPGGISGVLTFSGSVSVSDATAGNTLTAATASSILRPNGRGNSSQIAAGDTLVMDNLIQAVATLRVNAVPEIDGAYNCYLDPMSARQLFSDSAFRQLFQGAT